MARLHLEFAPPQRGRRLLWLLPCVVLLVVGATLYDRYLRAAAQVHEALIGAQERERRRVASLAVPVIDPLTAARFETAQAAIRRLTFPWEQFFAAIEASQNDNVVLLELRPDVEKSIVTVVGESRDFNAAVLYVQQMQAQAQFSEVYLVEHEVQVEEAARPVRFQIAARWHQDAR